jgi:hypothetical protein
MKLTDIQAGRRYGSRIGGSDFYVHNVHPMHEGRNVGTRCVSYYRVDDNAMRFVTVDDFVGMARLPTDRPDAARDLAQFIWDEGDRIGVRMGLSTAQEEAFDPDSEYGRWMVEIAAAIEARGLTPTNALSVFLRDVHDEALRAAELFPGDELRTLAFSEEAGEVVKAVLDESPERVRKEAVQACATAARIVLDGDGSVTQWRARKGLAPLGLNAVRTAKSLDGASTLVHTPFGDGLGRHAACGGYGCAACCNTGDAGRVTGPPA